LDSGNEPSFNSPQPDRLPAGKPLLRVLNRLQGHPALQAEELVSRANALLEERFGPASFERFATFAPECLGLMSEHTRYFDGFALMMPAQFGAAVAVRQTSSPASRAAFEDSTVFHPLGEIAGAGKPQAERTETCLLESLLALYVPAGINLEVAIVSSGQDLHSPSYLSTLGIAFIKALQAAYPKMERAGAVAADVQAVIEKSCGYPFSKAYPIATEAGIANAFVLVDTASRERLAIEAPPRDEVGWGIIGAGRTPEKNMQVHLKRKKKADEALEYLQRKGFNSLSSFRDLEHKDLHRALEILPSSFRPLVRYLVSENRRVQKLVVALRRKDWQMLGALLLMSYASQRNDLESTSPEAEAAINIVEQMSIDGMYGATTCRDGTYVLLAGQPYVVPGCLDRIQKHFETQFGTAPATALL
jgi:galactokinase